MPLIDRQAVLSYSKGLALAAIVGVLGAGFAQLFAHSLEWANRALFGSTDDITEIFARLPWYARLAIPLAGGAVAGAILCWATRHEVGGTARADYLETIDERQDSIPLRASLGRCLSSFFSIVSGGSLGREGAMIQLSATAASVFSGRLIKLRGEPFRLAIAMGATGGLAAVYHTPLAAAVFIAEIAFGGLELRRIGLLFTAAVAAAWAVSLTGDFSPLYALPSYTFDLQSTAVLAVVAVGIMGGVVSTLFLALIRASKRAFGALRIGLIGRMALGGLVVGAVAVVAPDVAGNGFAPITRVLSGESLAQPLFVLLALKIVATAAIIGSGAIGGLFTPALLIGALTGLLCAPTLAGWMGLQDSVVMLGVVGMAAGLAATTQAPLMSTLMVFEMTQEASFVFPLMIATIVAHATSSILGQSGVYAVTARHRARSALRSRLLDAAVGDLARAPRQVIDARASLQQAQALGLTLRARFLFLQDDRQHYLGAVSLHDVVAACESHTPAPALAGMPYAAVPVVYQDQKLIDVWRTVVDSPAEHTPVLHSEARPEVVGVLRKSDLLGEARNMFT